MIDFAKVLEVSPERQAFNEKMWQAMKDHFIRSYQHEVGSAFTFELKEILKSQMPKIASQLIKDKYVDIQTIMEETIERAVHDEVDELVEKAVQDKLSNLDIRVEY
jgi:predicted phage tail protein